VKTQYGDVPIAFTNMPPIRKFPAFTPLMKFMIGNLVEIMGQELAKIVRNRDNVFYNEEVISLSTFAHRLEVEAEEDDFFSDGVHPSRLTYQLWASDFADFLSEKVLR